MFISFQAFANSGLLAEFVADGKKHCFISNIGKKKAHKLNENIFLIGLFLILFLYDFLWNNILSGRVK